MSETPTLEGPPEETQANLAPEIKSATASQVDTNITPENKSPFQEEKERWVGDIKKILSEHKLVYDQDEFERRILIDKRFLRLSVVEFDPDGEDNKMVLQERFFKAVLPSEDKTEETTNKKSFIRQIRAQEYLDEHTDFPVTEVLDHNLDEDSGPLYVVMNWYQKGEGVGFMQGRDASLQLTQEHAGLATGAIRSLQHQEKSVPEDLATILDKRTAFENINGFKNNLAEILTRQVTGAGSLFSEQKRDFADVVSERLGISHFEEHVERLVEEIRPVIEAYQNRGTHLVHGDFSPNNIFLGDGVTSDKFIGLDFEWAAVSSNEVLAASYDFGNMRERAYINPNFQQELDQAMIESYAKDSHEEVGRAIVALGTLRSTLNLASYFENRGEFEEDPVLQLEREGTERDLLRAWEVLGLEAPSSNVAKAA